ncbi:MAG TPA: hypothetical protein VFW75_03000, partial [Acetobacteraceae bacterium]|nr:hypothetical protein [Acetobacteraceae bacterium]
MFGVGLAADRLGVGTISADLSGPNGYKLHRDWQIAVRPAHAPITLAQTALQAPGETFRLDPHQLGLFLPGSLVISVGYAGYAGIDAPSLLQSLYEYPFGCTEQLVSAAWPLIYFNDPDLLGRVPRDAGARAKVQHAIDTIIDREDPAGRFGLWHVGDGQASPWLDAYAVDFLMHARDGGFTVPDPALDRAEGWLAQEVQQADPYADDRFGPTQAASRAYGLYVLARAGRGDLGAMRRMHDTVTWSKAGTNGSRLISWGEGGAKHGFAEALGLAHLAGALSLMGDRARAHDTFGMAIANLGAHRRVPAAWFDFTYWSYVRDLAGVVAIAADSGENDLAQSLIDRFGRLDLTAPRLNTQEKAALLAAAHALNRDEPGRALAVNGRQIAPLKLPAALAPTAAEVQAGYAVTNSGSTDLWRTVMLTGSPATALPALAAGYTLDRRYFTLDGKPADPSHLRQNDRLIVALSGAAQDDDNHRTVLVDLLPAGWEIETPIRSEDQYPFLGALTHARVTEARDDRFVTAFDLGADLAGDQDREVDDDKKAGRAPLKAAQFRVAYVVRVVTPGHFARPEAVVDDMYRPQIMARTDSGETVADPR